MVEAENLERNGFACWRVQFRRERELGIRETQEEKLVRELGELKIQHAAELQKMAEEHREELERELKAVDRRLYVDWSDKHDETVGKLEREAKKNLEAAVRAREIELKKEHSAELLEKLQAHREHSQDRFWEEKKKFEEELESQKEIHSRRNLDFQAELDNLRSEAEACAAVAEARVAAGLRREEEGKQRETEAKKREIEFQKQLRELKRKHEEELSEKIQKTAEEHLEKHQKDLERRQEQFEDLIESLTKTRSELMTKYSKTF
jgi:hypothetical protein